MYDELIKICKEYIGAAAPMFVDSVLRKGGVEKDSIGDSDLDKIAEVAAERVRSYTLPKPIDEPLKKAILELKSSQT